MAQRRGVSTEDFSSERKERLSNIEGCLSELRGLRHVVQGLQKHWVVAPRKGMGLHDALVEVQSSFRAKQEKLFADMTDAKWQLETAKAKEGQDVGHITQLESQITIWQEDAARTMSYEAVLSGFGTELTWSFM